MRTDKGTKLVRRIVIGGVLCGLMAIGVQQTRAAAEVKPNVMVSLVQLNTELHGLRVDLSRTMTALEGVKTAAKKNEELIKPFAAFSSAYGELEAQVAKVR